MKKRYLLLLLLLPLAYAYGVATIQFKIFPFDQIRQIRNMISMDSVLAIRFEDPEGLTPLESVAPYEDRLVFLTYGQSNAANTGQLGYHVSGPVFMVYDGKAYPYADPALGTTGIDASVWGRVGDKLIERGAAGSVFFVNAAWGGASMGELARDFPYDFLRNQLAQALQTFGRVDGILIHHGERHNRKIVVRPSIGADMYDGDFREFLGKLRDQTDAPVYLAQVSYCGDRGFDTSVTDAQNGLIRDIEGVLRGPDSDALVDVSQRLPDRCHFSAEGLDALANAWVDTILTPSEE